MRRILAITLTLLVPLALAGLACAQQESTAAQQEAEEEHPEGEAAAEEEHPEGEAEGEEHPEGEAAAEEEHPEGEAAAEEEHPEGEAEGEEHPEEEEPPAQAAEELTIDQLADAITEWAEAAAAANGGYLAIEHPDTGESIEMTLDQVHRERLSRVGEQTYFACADFVGRDGTVYDLDVFMEGPNREALHTTEVTLHKVDGEARYTWYEEDGLWKKRPAA